MGEPKRWYSSQKTPQKPPELGGSSLPKCAHSLKTQDQGAADEFVLMGLVVRKCHFDVTACAEARRLAQRAERSLRDLSALWMWMKMDDGE